MIIAKEEMLEIEGDENEVLTETALILRQVYYTLLERHGQEEADEQMTMICRLAAMSDEALKAEAKALRAAAPTPGKKTPSTPTLLN